MHVVLCSVASDAVVYVSPARDVRSFHLHLTPNDARRRKRVVVVSVCSMQGNTMSQHDTINNQLTTVYLSYFVTSVLL